MNSKFKKFASHTVAVIIGLIIASCARSPRVEIVEVPKEVIKHVPVEHHHVVTKEVVKWKTKIKKVYVYNDYDGLHDAILYYVRHHVKVDREHRLSLYGGVGPKRLYTSKVTGGYKVELEKDIVLGVGYAYNLDSKYSIGFNVFSNETFLAALGIDF
jgi:hypothetical protein